MSQYEHECSAENAKKFWDWIKERGGVAIWISVNLSNPGASWSTPVWQPDGNPTPKPNWQVTNEPEKIVTDPTKIKVFVSKEVQRFHVNVHARAQGMSLKVTEGGTRRIRKALAKHGEGSYYDFDYTTQEAVIFIDDQETSLDEYAKTQGWS